MAGGKGDVFHNIELSKAAPGFYWHVYPEKFEANAANPASNARLAWRDGKHGMFYTGETPNRMQYQKSFVYSTRMRRAVRSRDQSERR